MGKISVLIMYYRGTLWISHHNETWSSWYIVWNFGWLGTWSILYQN